jgi:hypothetical protein
MRTDWSPLPTVYGFFSLFVLLSVVTSAIGLSNAIFPLNENQVLYLFSTSAQVLAGIYGLTLTGFIFFRNELSREEFEDETLREAVESLKQRDYTFLLFITAMAILTLLLANLAIANEDSGSRISNTLITNIGQSAFVTCLLAIAYFIFDVISPERIERASKKLQDEVDPNRTDRAMGSLEDFLKNFNAIESLLADSGQIYQDVSIVSYERKYSRRLSNARLSEILLRNGRINESLFGRIRELITLRNSIIHGADPVVSQDIVQTSAEVLRELRSALGL